MSVPRTVALVAVFVAGCLTASAMATPGAPTAADRHEARAALRTYAHAFADRRGLPACALFIHALQRQYIDQAKSRGKRATCARGFKVIRDLDGRGHVGRPRIILELPQTAGARRIQAGVAFGTGKHGFGFEVDLAKVRGVWRIYAENLCLVPSDCPAPKGT
jgi:hypothetical protein